MVAPPLAASSRRYKTQATQFRFFDGLSEKCCIAFVLPLPPHVTPVIAGEQVNLGHQENFQSEKFFYLFLRHAIMYDHWYFGRCWQARFEDVKVARHANAPEIVTVWRNPERLVHCHHAETFLSEVSGCLLRKGDLQLTAKSLDDLVLADNPAKRNVHHGSISSS